MTSIAPLRHIDGNEERQLGCDRRASPAARSSPRADARVSHLPHHVSAYADEIVDHLLSRERTLHRDGNYLDRQPDVTERMRIILIDWLVDVHIKFQLHPETFFLAVDYVDRYLMMTRGTRSTLQLVGVCAILLAAKHEEIWPPQVRECIYISANTYTRDEILATEREIAATLHFRLCVPTPFPFMSRVLECTQASNDTRHLAAYCLDIASLDYGCLQFLPSCIGFAAVLIANVVVENMRRATNAETPLPVPLSSTSQELDLVWGSAHVHYSRTDSAEKLDQLLACARSVLACGALINTPQSRYHAVRRKFTADGFGDVATRYPLPTTL